MSASDADEYDLFASGAPGNPAAAASLGGTADTAAAST
jgi:hypothetical protein